MEEKLKKLIYEICNVDMNKMTFAEKDYPLLSRRFGVMPYQMLVLFVKIEQAFNIKISEQTIVDEEFNTYNNILRIVLAHNEP